MKNLKRLFALLLALAMVMSMAVTVSATETKPAPRALPDQSHIVIHGAGAGTTYTVYRILDIADYSVDKDGKYVDVVYCLRTDPDNPWAAFFNRDDVKQYFTIDNGYVQKVDFVDGHGNEDKTAQKLAEIAKAYIDSKPNFPYDGQSKPLKSGTHTSDYRQIGMYVMISDRVAGPNSKPFYNVFTLYPTNTEILEKNIPVHSITKMVREDSQHIPHTDTGWQDRNAAEIAQAIDFRIKVDFAPTEGLYQIQDYMPNFDHLQNITFTFSGADKFEEGKDYTIDTKFVPEGETDPTGVGFKITLSPTVCEILEDGTTLEINYQACLKSSADTANINTAKLYHQDKATEENQNPEWKPVDDAATTTHTYKVLVSKVDEAGDPLQGAKFVLKSSTEETAKPYEFVQIDNISATDKDGKPITVPAYALTHPADETSTTGTDTTVRIQTIETNASGKFYLCGLDSRDNYYLVETDPPVGPDANNDSKPDITYAKADPAHIYITPDTDLAKETFIRTATVVNLPTVDMPETGGMGTTIFYIAGGLLTAAALILLVTKKRMSA